MEPSGEVGQLIEGLGFQNIVLALMIIAIAVLLSRFITRILDRVAEQSARRRIFFKNVSSAIRFVIFLFAFVLVATNVITFSRDALIALGGTIAVTVGFGLKDSVASLFAGIFIFFDRPFQVGDWVSFGGFYGEVTEIGLRSVRIVTLDDNLVSIPTNKFLTDPVASANAGALDMMVVMDFYIAPDSDFMLAKRSAYEATVTSKYVYLNKRVDVLLSEELTTAGLATRIRINAYVVDTRYEKRFLSDVTERVMQVFQSSDIRTPYISYRSDGGAAPLPA
jgi:small-conductance mechanosensitive channel